MKEKQALATEESEEESEKQREKQKAKAKSLARLQDRLQQEGQMTWEYSLWHHVTATLLYMSQPHTHTRKKMRTRTFPPFTLSNYTENLRNAYFAFPSLSSLYLSVVSLAFLYTSLQWIIHETCIYTAHSWTPPHHMELTTQCICLCFPLIHYPWKVAALSPH